jgi:hypothetical protein
MRGLILSQFNIAGAHYAPVCSPIVYVKQRQDDTHVDYGDIRPSHSLYDRFQTLLRAKIAIEGKKRSVFEEDLLAVSASRRPVTMDLIISLRHPECTCHDGPRPSLDVLRQR